MNLAPLAYSIAEAAKVSTLGRSKIIQLIGSGHLDATRVGRRVLIPADSLRRLVEDGAA